MKRIRSGQGRVDHTGRSRENAARAQEPLPSQADEILRALNVMTGHGRLAFPSAQSTLRPLSENTLNAAMRRLGFTKGEVTAHGFRAAASILWNESGLWPSDAIEAELAHVFGQRVIGLEIAVGAVCAGMDDALWNALVIEVENLIAEMEELHQIASGSMPVLTTTGRAGLGRTRMH
jgi:hypothetical protein